MNKGYSNTTIKTISSNFVLQFVTLIFSFISRSIFIYSLGEKYLGINGLFSNILGLLSLAELGVGSAITYFLYKPAENKDYERLKSLMSFYKKCYYVIGLVIFLIGIAIIPLIPIFVNFETVTDLNIYVLYFLFLLNSVLSYFLLGYRQAIFTAFQTAYELSRVQSILKIFATIINVFALIVFKNYYLYLVSVILGTCLNNLFIGKYAGKMYPFLEEEHIISLSKGEKKSIFKNVYSIFVWKAGNTFVTSTDNILISVLCGTSVVGYFSNYNLIYTSLLTVYNLILSSLIPALGNINAKDDVSYQKRILNNLHFMNYWLLTFCAVCLMNLLDPFIKIWLSKIGDNRYFLSEILPVLIGMNLWLTYIMAIVSQFRETKGLFSHGRYSQLLMGVFNLLLSFVLGKICGLEGIVLSTGISQFIFGFFLQPYFVFKYGFYESPKKFIKESLSKLLYFVLIYLISALCCRLFAADTIILWVCRGILCFVIVNLLIYIKYRKTDEMKYALSLLKNIFLKWSNKHD